MGQLLESREYGVGDSERCEFVVCILSEARSRYIREQTEVSCKLVGSW